MIPSHHIHGAPGFPGGPMGNPAGLPCHLQPPIEPRRHLFMYRPRSHILGTEVLAATVRLEADVYLSAPSP
jgi:hypothetical protein